MTNLSLKITALVLIILAAGYQFTFASTTVTTYPHPITNYAVTTTTTVIGQECGYKNIPTTTTQSVTLDMLMVRYPSLTQFSLSQLEDIARSIMSPMYSCVPAQLTTVTTNVLTQVCEDITETIVAPHCGDGVINQAREECDGNNNSLFSCNNHCKIVEKVRPTAPVTTPTPAPYNRSLLFPVGAPSSQSQIDMYKEAGFNLN